MRMKDGITRLPDGSAFFVGTVGGPRPPGIVGWLKYDTRARARRWLFVWRMYRTARMDWGTRRDGTQIVDGANTWNHAPATSQGSAASPKLGTLRQGRAQFKQGIAGLAPRIGAGEGKGDDVGRRRA